MSVPSWVPRPPLPPPTHTAVELDPGLQPERTSLAWSRTWLAMVTVSAVFLRWLPHYGPSMVLIPALTLLAAVGIALTQRYRTHRDVLGIRDEVGVADPWPPLLLLVLVLLIGAAGVWFVLQAP
ncbi:DUF202 domain-containing protein [Ornithinicoccus hortensis]|uniref:Uncharacterized protein DUF202 n=1 Tax=Ornithinicoccus hortensis TaxID=82346 RepID=A0A542YMD3_9MICO|nr:DUF202 domain-containing protein [Ornithinicoccus hortensis]TQL49248.1 uncharacterized protein DUF202 [Ornithinicoccus hortensis]